MFSLLVRRVHMYAGLFLAPWILMYTISTFVMNHRDFFRGHEPTPPPRWEKESERKYDGEFAPDAPPAQVALQLLASLDLDGAHNVSRPGVGASLVINRHDPVNPRRITFRAADRSLVVEKQVFETPVFLERMHRRRGYQYDYVLEDLWAFSVDLTILGILAWVLSGLWMWWEMKLTRGWGAAALIGGIALFSLFLAVL
jgi:hypothetical protein